MKATVHTVSNSRIIGEIKLAKRTINTPINHSRFLVRFYDEGKHVKSFFIVCHPSDFHEKFVEAIKSKDFNTLLDFQISLVSKDSFSGSILYYIKRH